LDRGRHSLKLGCVSISDEVAAVVQLVKVRLLFFSVLQSATGTDAVEWDCTGVETVGDVLNLAYARWPALEAWDQALLLAVDQVYVKRTAPVHDGAEIALMPPVQGG
jgi:molybdopterin converting factor small subunit